jgi:hypothetical protein
MQYIKSERGDAERARDVSIGQQWLVQVRVYLLGRYEAIGEREWLSQTCRNLNQQSINQWATRSYARHSPFGQPGLACWSRILISWPLQWTQQLGNFWSLYPARPGVIAFVSSPQVLGSRIYTVSLRGNATNETITAAVTLAMFCRSPARNSSAVPACTYKTSMLPCPQRQDSF